MPSRSFKGFTNNCMAKKQSGENSKKAAGNAKKETSANLKKEAELEKKRQQEELEWSKGSKSNDKKVQEEEKRQEALRKKAEKEAILAVEEAENTKVKPLLRQDKKAAEKSFKINSFQSGEVESYSASGIDAVLDIMAAINTTSDKLDRHPERRMKSAYIQFQEEEMPKLKAEYPKLRLSQLNEMLQKAWKKSPKNPMNQQHLSYNTLREEEREVLAKRNADKLESYREKS